jgi:membrane protein
VATLLPPHRIDPPEPIVQAERSARAFERWVKRRGGWARIVRNTAVGYFEQAGTRMAAALSYYSILVGGPILVLTLLAGSALFGEATTRETVAQIVERGLPPGADPLIQIADQMVRSTLPTASLAVVAGLFSLFSFTRALATIINVTLRTEGTEPFYRPFVVGPLLLLAVFGLLWGSWALRFAIDLIQVASGYQASGLANILLSVVMPFGLATCYFVIILAVVPRVRLSRDELLVPALFGALLWETVRHAFGWLVGSDSVYIRLFGPLGGVVALLAWVYTSSVILVLTGQLTWAYAMERRGRGRSAAFAPREAGLQGWIRPFHGDNAVNEDHSV